MTEERMIEGWNDWIPGIISTAKLGKRSASSPVLPRKDRRRRRRREVTARKTHSPAPALASSSLPHQPTCTLRYVNSYQPQMPSCSMPGVCLCTSAISVSLHFIFISRAGGKESGTELLQSRHKMTRKGVPLAWLHGNIFLELCSTHAKAPGNAQ